MSEPGLTLGRLIAAERNAQTALDLVQRLERQNAALADRVQRLESETAVRQQELQQLRMLAAARISSGPTAGG